MLAFNVKCCPTDKHPFLPRLIHDIYNFKGYSLKKEFAHPDYEDRTEPEIISTSIFPLGSWRVQYKFSFKETEGSSWTESYCQGKDESIWEFLTRVYANIKTREL